MHYRFVFWLLVVVTLLFFPGLLLGWAGLFGKDAGQVFEAMMMTSVLSALALVIWMLLACLRDPDLTPDERLKWELLLVAGGPITAFFFLHKRVGR